MKTIISMAALLLVSTLATAQDEYTCTIKAVSSLNKIGDLENKYQEPYIDQEFSVDRITGVMSGILQNDLGGTPAVVQPASKDQPFKVVTTSITNHGDVYYLYLEDFQYSDSIPFLFVQSGYIFHGTCI